MQDIGVSIITPPTVTSAVIREGYALGCRAFFLQPGTCNAEVEDTCDELRERNRLQGGEDCLLFIKSCVLVDLDCHHDF